MAELKLYLSRQEDDLVRISADKMGVSNSYIVRLILRDFYGLPIGGSGRSEIAWLSEIRDEHVRNLTPVR